MLKKNQKGFSIIELIVVVAIICLISVAGYPNIMKWYTKKQLRNDAHEVFAYLKDVQQDSLLNKKLCRVTVSSQGTDININAQTFTKANFDCSNNNYDYKKEGELTLKNSKLSVSGRVQVFSPNGCCSKDQEYTKEIEIIHKDDKNNGDDYGRYKIITKKATCFMNLEKDS